MHYGLCRPVVLFEFEEFGIVEMLTEVENIVNVCPTEAVDALCIVAHHAYSLPFGSEQQHDVLLYGVSVLILVNKHVFKSFRILMPCFLVVAEQEIKLEQQVVKIHGVGL